MLFSIFEGCQIGKKCPYWATICLFRPSLDMPNNMDLGKMLNKGMTNRFLRQNWELEWPENVDISNILQYPIHFFVNFLYEIRYSSGGLIVVPPTPNSIFSKI